MTKRWAFAVLAVSVGIGCGGGSEGRKDGADAKAKPELSLAPLVRGASPPRYVADDPKGKHLWKDVGRFYAARGHQPAWIVDGAPTEAALLLAERVGKADEEGLAPGEYELSALRGMAQKEGGLFGGGDVDPALVARTDVRTTWVFLRYASDLLGGRVDPTHVDRHWTGKRRDNELLALAQKAIERDGMQETLDSLPPRHPQYRALRDALGRYRQIAREGDWPALPAGLSLKKGRSSPAVPTLRRRLALEGDLDPSLAPTAATVQPASLTDVTPPGSPSRPHDSSPANVYDEAVAAAVRRFEERHGLTPDGILDRATVAEMNVPASERVRTLELNLERWRWMPEHLGERYLFVNIPTFSLQGFEKDSVTLNMKVVVGKEDTPTPIFADEMEAVVFSPYWNIPPSILRDETAPAILKNPGYLYDNELEVVRGGRVVDPWGVDWSSPDPGISVRQRPGAKNALGQAKFVFPNTFDVYLHDTPAESYFARVQRAYSHGCVRVEQPLVLAEWVLRGSSRWSRDRIVAAMQSGQEQHVPVRPRIPVYLAYTTSWVEPGGRVQFRKDVYGHDARQRELLPGSVPRTPKAAPVAQVAEKQSPATASRASTDVSAG